MTPFLKTPRLLLTAPHHRLPDVERHVRWLAKPAVTKYSEQRHISHTVETQWQYIKSFDQEQNHFWEISARGTPKEPDYDCPIGTITARRDIINQVAEVGMMIGRQSEWGKGYGTEAWLCVCDWLLSDGIRKIEAGTMSRNYGMIRIFEKSSMTIEAMVMGHFLVDGEPANKILYGRFK